MRVACASVEIASMFKTRVGDLYSYLSRFNDTLYDTLGQLLSDCENKRTEYERLKGEVQALYETAKKKKAQCAERAAAASNALKSTPATVTETKTDSNGNTVSKEVANPEHQAALAEKRAAVAREQAAADLVRKIESKLRQINNTFQALGGIGGSLRRIQSETSPQVRRMTDNVSQVSDRMTQVIDAIKKYTEVRI